MHIYAVGQSFIVLNTLEAITEILERNLAVTSDRPKNFVVDVMTDDSFMSYLGQVLLLDKSPSFVDAAIRFTTLPTEASMMPRGVSSLSQILNADKISPHT